MSNDDSDDELSDFTRSHLLLNEAILEVEDALREMAEKAPADVSLGSFKYKGHDIEARMYFRLAEGGWNLSYAVVESGDPNYRTLISAPHMMKRVAVDKLDDLLVAIRNERQLQTSENVSLATRLHEFAVVVHETERQRGE